MLAGEASGDLLGANLARELLRQQPDLRLSAMGGKPMQQAGVDIIVDNQSLAVMGWWEIIKNFAVIHRAMRTIKQTLKNDPPDLLILIDYPGFNLRMAKFAKAHGVKVLYYVSPHIWAWKYGRIKTIKRCVSHIAVLFDFEVEIYRREQVPVTFVGHPLTTLVHASETPETIYHRYQLDPHRPIIALFPGSRRQELKHLLPIVLAATVKIREAIPGVQWVMPLATNLRQEDLHLPPDITVVKNDTYNLLSICTAAIVKSGTSTLEVALSQVPLVIIYKGGPFNYWMARMLVKVKQIGLCNIVARKLIAKELIQYAVTADNIAAETIRLVTDQAYRAKMLADLAILHATLSTNQPGSETVAQIALKLID